MRKAASTLTVGTAANPAGTRGGGSKRRAKPVRSTAQRKPGNAARKKPARKSKPASTRHENPKGFPNIDRSAFRRGEYVGYADGVWKIRRTGSGGWYAANRDNPDAAQISGKTLAEISRRLQEIAESADARRYGFDKPKQNPAENELRFLVVVRDRKGALNYWTGRKFSTDRKSAGLFSESAATALATKAANANRYAPCAVIREDFTTAQIEKFVTARGSK